MPAYPGWYRSLPHSASSGYASAAIGPSSRRTRRSRKSRISWRGAGSRDKGRGGRAPHREVPGPLLRSAYDLQSRIYNVCLRDGFTGSRDPEYFRLNTLSLFGEFLAWLEIIRREIQFLDVGAVQRAIGELMLVRTDGQAAAGPRYECMGYAAFVAAHEDLAFAKWFTRIGDAAERFERNRERLPVPESPRRRPSRQPGAVTSRAPRS